MALGQTVITPLQGAGQTNTVVSTQGKQTTITTQSLRDGNAFSTYSNFAVGQGDQVKMLVPQGANWWVNIVRDAQVRVDGRLESRLANGNIGGNLLFIDSHGFAVGPQGRIDAGRLVFAAPSTAYVDGLLSNLQNGGLSGATVGQVLGGQFERSATGSVNIQGHIHAAEGLTLMAGRGGTDAHAVTVSGQVVVNGRVAGSAVNLGDLKSLMPLQDVDGVIDITTPGSIMLNGMLLSDSAQFTRAGAVRLVAGQDIAVTAQAKVSASGAAGSGQAGGQVTLMAHRDIANQAGAQLHARGDGAGAGGAIEYSGMGHMTLDGMRFDAGSQSGVSGQILLDPTVANITGTTLTGGADITYNTPEGGDQVTVKSGAIINTRKVADGQDATSASVLSTGHSGSITINSPNIVVESGALLDASVINQGGTTYSAGDIHLNAEQSSNWATFVALSNANTSIDVAGTLKGHDIDLYAFSQSKALFGGVAASVQEKAVDLAMTYMQSPLRLSLTYVEAKGDAKVNIQGTASIQASNDLTVTAKADRYAGAQQQVGGSALANLGAGFAQLEGTTQIEVKSGASLSAGNDMNLTAASKSKVLMTSKVETETNAQTGAANIASVVFAGSRSDVNTAIKVNSGATLNSVQDLTMEAYHSGQYNTAAEVKIYGGGTAGVVGALSLQKSDTRATLDGSATVGGVARVTALNFVSKGAVSAKSANSSKPSPDFTFPETLELSNEEAKKGLFDGFVSMADKLASAQEAASGNSSSSSTPKLRMAGALAWSESEHSTFAGLGSGASLVSTGHAIVDSHSLAGAIGGVAMAETTSKTTGADAAVSSISAAFNYGKHTFNTTAKVGSSATLTGSHVAVNAATDMPEFFTESAPIEWDDPFKVYANLYGIANLSFLDAVSSKVGAKSSASGLAASGAVSLHSVNNNTTAWVDKSAQVTATSASEAQWKYDTNEVYFDSDIETLFSGADPYRLDKKLKVIEEFASETRDVVINGVDTGVTLDELKIDHTMNAAMLVKAKTHVQTIQLAGGEAPESSGSGTAVGGTFTLVDRANRTIAGIADSAVVSAKRLDVLAFNKDWSLTVAPTAGSGEGIAANAMVAYNKLSETATASISREAQVSVTDLLNLKAELALWSFGIVGAVTKSSGSGVGIGLSMNEISGNTKAYIGDNDADAGGANTAEGAVGFVKSGILNVLTLSTGKIGAVGIAGAMAGGPAKPAMADKADAGSSSSQAKAGGGSASPLAAVTGGLQDQGAASGGDSGGASTPPKFSVAGAGAIVTNFSDVDTTSIVEGAVIQGVGAATTQVVVRANQDLTQVSVAGGGALTMASNPTTSSTTSIAGAVAIQKSDDDTIALISNSTLTQLSDVAGALQVQALKGGERTAVATGISANLSKTTTSDLSIVGSVSITNLTDDTQASIQSSTVTGNAVTATALNPVVMAYDRSRVGAGGGALSLSTGKGSAGVGATVSVVDLEGSTEATIVGGSMTRVKDVSVAALSSHKIVAAGAVAGVQTDSTSAGQLMGAFVINDLSNTMTAGITGGALVHASGNVDVRAGGAPTDNVLDALLGVARQSEIIDFEMEESDNGYTNDIKVSVDKGESVLAVAGTLSLTMGKAASSVGLSYVQNRIQTTYSADLNGNITATGNVNLDAWSRANILGVAAGLGATKGKFSGMGSASVNLIGQRTSATVSGGSVTAASLNMASDTQGNIFSLAGNVSVAAGNGGSAAGGAVSYTQTGTQTYTLADATYTVNGQSVVEKGGTVVNRSAGNAASITGATVNTGGGDVNVVATNRSNTQSVAASGAFSDGQFAFTGTATWNEIGDVTDARISGSTVTAQDIKVQAGNGAGANSGKIFSLAGGAAASATGSSVALAFGFNTIESSRSAQILNSVLSPTQNVFVWAYAGSEIQTISATIAASAQNSAGGSSSTNWLNGSSEVLVDNVTFNGSASSLSLHASNSGKIESLAGAVAGGGSNVIGGAVAINLMGEGSDDFKVTAKINNSRMNSATSVVVDADLTGEIKSIAAAGGGSGSNAINGSVTRNLIAGDVTAEIAGLTQNVAANTLIVQADQTSSISSLAGVVNGGGANAVGGAISVNDIAGTVTAKLGSSSLKTTGQVRVLTNMDSNIKSVAAAGSGAGNAAVNGSNTTNSLTSTVRAIANNVTQTTGSSYFQVWAHDGSDIDSFAGTVSGGGTAAVGAALALNFMGRTAGNEAASKIVSADITNSSLQVSGTVQVKAHTNSTLDAFAVAAGGGGTFAVTGSNTTNILDDSIAAKWVGSTLVGGSGFLEVSAQDTATVHSEAGNFAGGGTVAVGAALAVNKINTAVNALVQGTSSGKIATGDVRVHADSDAVVVTVAVGMSASGTAGVQGSVSVSQIGSTTSALVNSSAIIEATDSVAVDAESHDRIKSLAGAVGLGLAGVGAAGGVLVNMITSTTSAGVEGSGTRVSGAGNGDGILVFTDSLSSAPDLMNITEVTNTANSSAARGTTMRRGVMVQATSVEQIVALTTVVGGGTVGIGGSVNVDSIDGSTRAYVDSAQINPLSGADASQEARVMAADHALIASTAATVAGGVATGVAGAVGSELIKRSTTAEVIDSATVNAQGEATVKAASSATVAQISAGAAIGGVAGVAGSGNVALMQGNTQARVLHSSVNATDVSVLAEGANRTNLIAGSIGAGGVGGVGMSFSVNVSGSTVKALVANSAIRADGDVKVLANNTTQELAVSATAGVGVFGGAAIGATVTVLEGLTEANITGTSSVDSRLHDDTHYGVNSLTVAATESVNISHNAGAAGAGKLGGVGTAANVLIGKSQVIAGAAGSSLKSEGAVSVAALREADIDMVTATAGGGGLAGISGAVGVLIFGAAPNNEANSEVNSNNGTMSRVSDATESSKVQGTGSALSDADKNSLNSNSSYNTQTAYAGASGAHSTSATLSASSVTAGSVAVSSLDKTEVLNNAGSLAVGGLGMSAGVALTTLGGANNASISSASLTTTGGVNVDAGTRELHGGTTSIQSRAIAGAGGLVGLGAAVSLAKNETANSASLTGTVSAGGAVNVSALDDTSMRSESYGASVGAVSVGVVVAKAEQSGSVLTQVGGSISGQGVSISAQRDATTNAYAKGGSAGVVSGSGAEADASDGSSVKVALLSGASLNAGQGNLTVAASSNPYANTEALGVSVASGVAIGVSLAKSTVSSEVAVNSLGSLTLTGQSVNISAVLGAGDSAVRSSATAGAGGLLVGATGVEATSENKGSAKVVLAGQTLLSTTGDVSVSAIDSMDTKAFSTGIGAGGYVGIGVAISKASSNTTVAAQANQFKGLVGGVLSITATGNESIDSEAIAGSGGLVAGAGAEARVDHDQSVTADLGSGSGNTLTVGSYANVNATRQVRYNVHSTSATAGAFGASGAVTHATLDGSVTARVLDSTKLVADGLRVLATNDLARTDLQGLNAEGGGGGVISGAGADIYTRMNGDALASVGNSANLALEGLFEVRAYNEIHGSSRGQMDVGGAIPIALVETKIETTANADAKVGNNTKANSYGETHVNALSYIDLEANSVSKTYGLAAAAQGNAYATANVNNRVTIGTGTELISAEATSLLVGQDKDFNRNKHFVTARTDLFNHAAIPVSINPDADATLNLNNTLTVSATAVRSGATIKLGGIEGSYVVEGKGKVSDWTRDLGEMMGISSEYGKSDKNMNSTASLSGQFEAGFGNKQRLIVSTNGTILENTGDVRYTITKEDLGASAGAYVARLYDQLARYGDVPEVRAFVEAELSFYFATLIREGLAESYTEGGKTYYVALSDVEANFLNIKNMRAGSGNIELYGKNVSGSANLMARADSEILVENRSPLNLRVYNMTVDADGGFVKYNGTYITKNADIGALNATSKTTSLTVDSIDTRGGGANQQLPTLTVKNTFVPMGAPNRGEDDALMMYAPDGTSANLYADEMRAPEVRVNGTLYNKLGTINLSNTAGSISVVSENSRYTPRLDGKEITVTAGKNFMLSSPSISQSVGGSPESLYAVHYSDDQQRILNNLGIGACGSARPVNLNVNYDGGCYVAGAGGIYASGGIFMGARYLNINGTIQSGQADYNATLTTASVGTQISNWQTQWRRNRGTYLANGTSSLVQVSGPLPTDSEAEINKQFANGTINATDRTNAINAMAARRTQPIIYFDAETGRLKVAPTNVTGGLVELVGSVINTGGGVIRALDGYARMNIDNQTSYGIDLLGLDTGGDKGVVRITDLSKPIYNGSGVVTSYEVTTYEKDANGVFKGTVTDGRAPGARVISVANNALGSPSGSVKARFNYNPMANSTYSWSAGYETMSEKSYYYQNSSWLGFIPGGSTSWNSVNTVVKTTTAMPEDVFVSANRPIGNGNFSMQVKKSVTDDETETYYRSWRKCGFLCIKKTYYIQRRTEVGFKYLYTQRVKADHAINVELVGYNTGALTVSSGGDIRLGGNISNASGNVSLTSTNGSILQLSGGAVVEGIGLNFRAKSGIGIQAAPINLITGNGSFTAVSDSGAIAFHSNSGPLRINQVSTTGEVWLDGAGDILGLNPSAVHVTGKKIYLSAPTGGIGEFNGDGSVKSTLNIQTQDSTFGGLTAKARGGIAIKQPTGNLWVNQVISGGDVYLEAGGDLIDNNRNETRDERTEAELLALWSSSALQGASAEASRQATLNLTRTQYRRYWALRDVRDVVTDGSGNVTSYAADPITSDYKYTMPAEDRLKLQEAGISDALLAKAEADRTAEVLALHQQFGSTVYQSNNEKIIDAVNLANVAAGKSEVGALATWSDAELKNPLPKSIFSKSSTSTQTRIEEPNVVGNRVVLRPGGKIGRDDGSVTIPLLKATRLAQGKTSALTDDEKLVIMSAETDDMSLNRDTWTLTVVKKDTFNVLSNRLNVTSNGFVYLGADTTDAYPTGGTANLEKVIGTGEIRIKVTDSILSMAAAGVSVIQGQKAILEAAQGSIGSAAKPVQITLRDDSTGTLTARAQQGIWIHEIGTMRAADIFTPASATLTATGAIVDARPVINYPNTGDRTVRSIEANTLTLAAAAGAIGELYNPMVIKVGAGGVNATTPVGHSVYLKAAENSPMTVGTINAGLDAYVDVLDSYLNVLGSITAKRDVYASADGHVLGANFTGGAVVNVNSTQGNISGSKVVAGSGTALLDAEGSITLTSVSSAKDVVATAGTSFTSTTASAGRDLTITANAGAVSSTSLSATGNMTIKAKGAGGDIRSTVATASAGWMKMEAGGALSTTIASAQGLMDLYAVQTLNLLNASSKSTLKLESGQDVKAMSVAATGNTTLKAARDIQVSTVSSATGAVTATSDTGLVKAQTLTASTGATVQSRDGDVNISTLTVTAGGMKVDAGNAINLGTARSTGLVDLSSGMGLTASSLTSTGAGIDIDSVSGQIKVSTATAKNELDVQAASVTLGTFSAATANLRAASSMGLTTGTTTGAMVIHSQGAGSLGSMTATAGKITADTVGAMTVGVFKATELDITGGTGLSASSLISTTGKIDVDTTTGNLSISSATAKTQLDAQSVAGALSVGTYTADTADLTAKTDVTLTTGTVAKAVTVLAERHASLGQLTSTTAKAKATSGGTMTATLVKGTAVELLAGTGLTATTLTSTAGDIDAKATTGALKITTATATGKVTANALVDDLTVGTFTAAQAQMLSGAAMRLTTGTTTGAMVIHSQGAGSLGSMTATAGKITADTVGAMTVGVFKATELDITGGTGLSASSLISTTGKIDVDTTTGNLSISSATAKTQLDAQSVAGALSVGTYTADTADLTAKTDVTLTTGTVAKAVTVLAERHASLGQLTSTTAKAKATSGGTMTATLVKGTAVELLAGTGLTATTLTSTAGDIDAKATTGALKITTATATPTGKLSAQAVAGDLTVLTFSAGSADLKAGNNLAVTTGNSTSDLVALAGRNAVLGAMTSTAGQLKVDTTGTLSLTTGKAANAVDVSGRAGVTATTLTSTTAQVDVDSVAGSVSISSANARTNFNAKSYGAMTVGTFAVTAGWAKLISEAAALSITTGSSTGNIGIEGGTNVALGNLTTTGGEIDALARTGGMTLGTLKATSKVKLRAASAWSNGQAISGTALYASQGNLDVLATQGGISVATLSGTTQSSVATAAGAIKISTVLGFSPDSLLTITAIGGIKNVPVKYR